jgi:hypothetical protein
MAKKSIPKVPKPPVIKVQTPVVKPGSIPGQPATLSKIQDSVDRRKK